MKLFVRFFVEGRPVAWSTPYIGNSVTATGRKYRFATSSARMRDWQATVRYTAQLMMAGRKPTLKAACLTLEFCHAGDPDLDGRPWAAGVAWSPDKQAYVKSGETVPDLTNLVKATEDALQPAVYADDAQVCYAIHSRVYGRREGVTVTLYEVEPDEHPGGFTPP